MSDNRPRNLPALLGQFDDWPPPGLGFGNPGPTRNLLVGLFRLIGDAMEEISLRSQAEIDAARVYRLDEKTKVIEATGRLQTAFEQFHARRLGLPNPADQEQFLVESHKRVLAVLRREKEVYEAGWQTLGAAPTPCAGIKVRPCGCCATFTPLAWSQVWRVGSERMSDVSHQRE